MAGSVNIYPILSAHSFFSFGRGVVSPELLCEAAAARGVTHLALTDTDGLYGFVDFVTAARSNGMTPIAGVTLPFDEGSAILLADSREGYTQLCKLISRYHSEPLARMRQDIAPKGLVLLSRNPAVLRSALEWLGSRNVFAMVSPETRSHGTERTAERLGIATVISPVVYLLRPKDREVHLLQRAIALRTSMDRVERGELWPVHGTVPSRHHLNDAIAALPKAWRATIAVAERCAMDWAFEGLVLPRFSKTSKEAAEQLTALTMAGAAARYPDSPAHALALRLNSELERIISRGLADYFLLVHDIVQKNPVTCGRGSAASSVVSYCLGITHVDPLAADLYFDRFLGPGRSDVPDIDVDFPWDERPEILQRLFASRPKGEVALVANHVTFRTKAAIRESGRVLGLPEKQLTELTRRAARLWRKETTPEEAAKRLNIPGLEDRRVALRILRMASRIRRIPRHLSRHSGGVVIVSGGVDRIVPYQPLPDGLQLIQWEKDQTEDAGLVKIDLLGNRSLSVVRDTIKMVKHDNGHELSYPKLNPLNDEQTKALLAQGESMGIFYVESPAMRQLQQKAGTGDFENLVVHSSLIRPAANRWINEYVRRLRGGAYPGLHPFLDELLHESMGILCYQEDVMRAAVELAGFSHAKADQLRRSLSGKKGIPLKDLAVEFKGGLLRQGFSDTQVDTLWSMVESFSGYSFCKAHSASYALVSFKAAYLKAHHPPEFMAALLNNGGGYYSTQAYVSELRRMGLDLRGPDINQSEVDYTAHEKSVRVGLKQVRELGLDNARRIVDGREDRLYRSLDDFLRRCPVPVPAVACLIQAGAFDGLHGRGCRTPLLRQLAKRHAHRITQPDLDLFPEIPEMYGDPPDGELASFQEMETLGFTLNGHPLDLVPLPPGATPWPARLLPSFVGMRVLLLGWYVTAKPVRTKTEEEMAFVSFEDRATLYETVFFPKQYRQVAHHLRSGRAYLVHGKVTEDWGTHIVEVEKLQPLPPIVPNVWRQQPGFSNAKPSETMTECYTYTYTYN